MELSDIAQEDRQLVGALKEAIVEIDSEKAKEVAEKIVERKIDPRLAMFVSRIVPVPVLWNFTPAPALCAFPPANVTFAPLST